MYQDFGANKSVAEVDIPQVLLESGKFVEVCRLVESLVGAKKPSSRHALEPSIFDLQKEIKITSKEIATLFDRYILFYFILYFILCYFI